MVHVDLKEKLKNVLSVKSVCGGCIIDKKPTFSKDGSAIFVAQHNSIQVYSAVSGDFIRSQTVSPLNIVSWDVVETEDVLVICTNEGQLLFWNWKTGILVKQMRIKILEEAFIIKAAFISAISTQTVQLLYTWTTEKIKEKLKVSIYNTDTSNYKNLDIYLKNQPHYMSVSSNSKLFVIAQGNKVYVNDTENKKNKVHLISDDRYITALCCHPHEMCFATGDNTGRILVWCNIFKSKPTRALYHWHKLPVQAVIFSQGGTHLYSGGNECVLVKWVVDMPQHKTFLPRVVASIQHISVSSDNVLVAYAMANNVIHIMDSQRKLKTVLKNMSWGIVSSHNGGNFSAGLHYDSRTQSIILNSSIGHIQFFNVFNTTLLYYLDITSHNKLTQERNTEIINIDVNHIAISDHGNWLATVEERNDPDAYFESRLKFWNFNTTDQIWVLNTVVSLPHEGGVIDLKFKPSSNKSSDLNSALVISIGKDKTFKIWNLVDNSTIYRTSKSWTNIATGYYLNRQPSCLDFASDGSLVAFGFGPSVTVWLPDTCTLKCSLVYTPYSLENIQKVLFGNVDNCHLIVSVTEERIAVWNLLSLTIMWTVPLHVSILCKDIKSSYMAAFTKDDKLFVFVPQRSQPVYIHENLCGPKNSVLQAVFVPNKSPKVRRSWQQHSQLYFIDCYQELLTLEDLESYENGSIQLDSIGQYKFHNPFLSLRAEKTISDRRNMDSDEIIQMRTELPGAISVQQLVKVPAHTCAPMRYMCESVIRSLVLTNRSNKNASKEDAEDENIEMFIKLLRGSADDSLMELDDSDAEEMPIVKKRTDRDVHLHTKPAMDIKSKENDEELDRILIESTELCKKLIE